MAEEARNIANGNPGDVDFMGMIQSFRDQRYEAIAAKPSVQGPAARERKLAASYIHRVSVFCVLAQIWGALG